MSYLDYFLIHKYSNSLELKECLYLYFTSYDQGSGFSIEKKIVELIMSEMAGCQSLLTRVIYTLVCCIWSFLNLQSR